MNTINVKTQIVIFGGGVSGLWLLNRLRQQGVSCVLIEKDQLGGGQTTFSQGIIHGGLKYALMGTLTSSAKAMQHLPDIWRACLQGQGEIDLSRTEVISAQQYLWSPGSLGASLMTFLASKSLRGKVERVVAANYPTALATLGGKGAVYALQEPVLAVKTLVKNLAMPCRAYFLQAELSGVEHSASGDITLLHCKNQQETVVLQADTIISLAGKGNQALAKQFGLTLPRMQLRPLAMVTVTAPHLPILFAHVMQSSNKPRITITTHQSKGNNVWYLGGDLAETGVKRTAAEQVEFAYKELRTLLPQFDFSAAAFQVLAIDRAEALDFSGLKPDSPTLLQEKNVIIGWPTKLAFAPLLAQQIINVLPSKVEELDLQQYADESVLATLKKPTVANYPWE